MRLWNICHPVTTETTHGVSFKTHSDKLFKLSMKSLLNFWSQNVDHFILDLFSAICKIEWQSMKEIFFKDVLTECNISRIQGFQEHTFVNEFFKKGLWNLQSANSVIFFSTSFCIFAREVFVFLIQTPTVQLDHQQFSWRFKVCYATWTG